MTNSNVQLIPIWQIPKLDPGYLYVVRVGSRFKIGKSKSRTSRLRAAKTWLPDMKLVGVKPFWMITEFEKALHEGLAQWWYEGEWFHLGRGSYLSEFLVNFGAFSDADARRDLNSIDFIHWINDFSESAIERASRQQGLRAFQRDVSDTRKGRC